MTAETAAPQPSRVRDLMVLMKIRLNALVVFTTAGGYYMATTGRVNAAVMLMTCVGTTCVASGAAAINQIQERDRDRLMDRTKRRPVADGRMSVGHAQRVGWGISAAGVLLLWLGAGALPALVAVATFVSYVAIYTPLKPRSGLATIVGAVPGALPPLIGWAAASGTIADVRAWSLFLIMFLWQLPHFLAIAWLCRDDYARGGFPMLSVIDSTGAMAGRQAALYAATLVLFSILPYGLHMTSGVYAIGAFGLGLAQFALALGFAWRRTTTTARSLFLGSITYLPLLWILMAVERQ